MSHQTIGIIAGLVSLFSYGLYIYQIWWGETRPSKSSWWILSVVWTVILLNSISLAPGLDAKEKWGAIAASWLSIAYIVGSLAIAVSTIWRGAHEKWRWTDYVCAFSAGVAIIFYLVVKNPEISLVLSFVADFFGLLPTIENAWKYPEQEDFLAWCLTVVAAVIGLFAVSHWSLSFAGASDWLSPVYLTVFDGLTTALLVRKFFKHTTTSS